MVRIDTQKVINNVYEIAKHRKVMIKDLEQSAGVSIGYLSKMNRPDARLPLDVVSSIANDFGMSVDALINYDSAGLTTQEQKIVKLFEKLITDTNGDRVEWKLYREDFYSSAFSQQEIEGKKREGLPPLNMMSAADVLVDRGQQYVCFTHESLFLNFKMRNNITTKPISSYLGNLGKGVQVYVIKTNYLYSDAPGQTLKHSFMGYEMYFVKDEAVTRVCQAEAAEYPTYLSHFEKLVMAVKNYDARGKLDKNANAIIDDYLGTGVVGKEN